MQLEMHSKMQLEMHSEMLLEMQLEKAATPRDQHLRKGMTKRRRGRRLRRGRKGRARRLQLLQLPQPLLLQHPGGQCQWWPWAISRREVAISTISARPARADPV